MLTNPKPQKVEIVDKKWGYEVIVANNEHYCGKVLVLNKPDYISSIHYHREKIETFYPIVGDVGVEVWTDPRRVENIDPEVYILSSDHTKALTLPAGTPHRFRALGYYAELMEVSTEHNDNDVVRIEESMPWRECSDENHKESAD